MKAVEQQTVLDQDISTNGHLVVPKSTGYVNIINKHRRAGSNGTTGDESCTTDEEELPEDNDTNKNKEETNGMFEYEEEFGKFSEEPYKEKRKLVPYIDTDEIDCAITRNNNESLNCCKLNGVYNGFDFCEKEVDLSRRVPELREPADDDLELSCKHHQTLVNGAGSVNGNSDDGTWGRSVVEVKEAAFARLQNELRDAHQELKLRDEEVERLSRIRQDVEAELEDLTASLFQEAHNMVREANIRQAAAERALKESQMQVDVLTAEVAALKTLVLTSTPSRPNPHLHPQIGREDSDSFASSQSENDWSPKIFGWILPKWMQCVVPGVTLFNKKHRRSPSHFNLKYGRENSPPDSPVKEHHGSPMSVGAEVVEPRDGLEVDPVVHKEFLAWKSNPKLDKTDPFISRIYDEDIRLCLAFNSTELSERVLGAAESGTIFIEAVSDKSKTMFPKRCALLEVPRQCFYRMKLGDQDTWYSISQICRNRITAVCNFLNYLRYIERGLVKSSVHDVYWEIARLRKEMVLARLGLVSNS